MKYWLSHLPLEVWVDVYRYPWISREELGKIVDRFRNRKYAEYLQFYLHDWGKHGLKNHLIFVKNGFYKYVPYPIFLDFPQTPVPANIKSFERISIYHFDAQAIAFLRLARPILSGVNLDFCAISPENMEKLRIILVNLLPLLNGIRSLSFDVRALATVKQSFGGKLDKIKQLTIYDHRIVAIDEAMRQSTVNFLLNCLTDGHGPRCCKTYLYNGYFEKMLPAIREEFIAAKTTSTFALTVHFNNYLVWEQYVEFHLENNIGEELHSVKEQYGYGYVVRITRHQANCGKELEEWVGANGAESHRGRIEVINPTVGLIDTTMDVRENFDMDQQPSTSQKTRMI